MKNLTRTIILALLALALGACGEPEGRNLSKVQEQPSADLEKGKSATTIDEWAKANPKNGAPGSGEGGGK